MIATVVIPTYNEKNTIKKTIQKVFSQKIPDVKLNIIVVDDNSPDGTAKIAKKFKNVFVLSRPCKMGLGSAYLAGFKKAFEMNADVVFEMDADLSHDPKYLKDFIKDIKEGSDVVIGSRYIDGGGNDWPISRKIVSKGANILAKIILWLPAKDSTSGYRCYKTSILKKIDFSKFFTKGYAFQEEMLYYCFKKGAKISEIPIFFPNRKSGASKLKISEISRFPFQLLKVRFFSENSKSKD
ncbi:MAG: polyprenol monophosphomannose synthase [archaeon]